MKHNLLKTLLLSTIVSCGGSMYGDNNDNNSSSDQPQEQQSQEGIFRGVANAVNTKVTSSTGALSFINEADRLEVQIFGSGPVTTHGQYLHTGTRCPTSTDDINNDGVIDATEGTAVYGARVLPLDSELETAGGSFPAEAQYSYAEGASTSSIQTSLDIPTLEFEGKVVTIQGVPETTTLPATTQGAKADFPIACGVLQKVPQ